MQSGLRRGLALLLAVVMLGAGPLLNCAAETRT